MYILTLVLTQLQSGHLPCIVYYFIPKQSQDLARILGSTQLSEYQGSSTGHSRRVTIDFALPNSNRGKISVKGIRATSACKQQGAKLALQLAWLAGKELVTIPRYQDLQQLENRTALKLGLKQFNLQLMNLDHTAMCIQNVNLFGM